MICLPANLARNWLFQRLIVPRVNWKCSLNGAKSMARCITTTIWAASVLWWYRYFWNHTQPFTSFWTAPHSNTLVVGKNCRQDCEQYGTMYHYNYMGSFSAMMVPLFLVLALFLKNRKQQIFYAVMTAIALFLLLGSTYHWASWEYAPTPNRQWPDWLQTRKAPAPPHSRQ